MIDAGEEPENKEEVHVDTCIRSTSTGKRTQIQAYAFSAESEEKTVEFSNASYKGKILQEFAQELGTECEF